MPPPVAVLLAEAVTCASTDVWAREASTAVRVLPAAGTTIRPTPEPTEKFDVVPVRAQVPPRSALPQPEPTVRPNASSANAFPASNTVTWADAVSVAPSSSVTVSSIV